MKKLENPLLTVAQVYMFIALIFYIIFSIGGIMPIPTLLIIYFIIFLYGLCLYIHARKMAKKSLYLKDYGISYEAKILDIIPSLFWRIKGCDAFYVKCSYQDQDGKSHLAKSGLVCFKKSDFPLFVNIVPMPKNITYHAVVYVDPTEPIKHFVDIHTNN